ncbi:RDD family protein [Terricaulis sp.]|uniref:RDD family protein n=1 Tax=Terricaulis sp. TaxID=2768686 RepID=UPI002AC397CE|nr:RDD family protein [Terricaulis sp.]MDZ4689845.1 RDD family protein [Terricaulis sp.]
MLGERKTAVQKAAEDAGALGLVLRRWAGAWLDLIALAILVCGPFFALALVPALSAVPATYFVIPLAVLGVLYFPVTEGFWGQSIGKVIAGLKVVDRHGRPPGFGRALVRTLFRLIEVNPLLAGGTLAGLVVLFTRRKQRIGDLIAETYVLDVDMLRQMEEVDATLAAMRSSPTT